MLEVGNGGMTESEERAHFSMWCMLAAPLIAGNDLKNMATKTLAILTNTDAIRIDQDSLGIQGLKHKSEDGLETWFKPLSGGDWAVCFLNRSDSDRLIEFDWLKNVVSDPVSNLTLDASTRIFKIKEIWTKADFGTTKKALKALIQSHDVLMLRISPVGK
jgi:alpha-galactosidase